MSVWFQAFNEKVQSFYESQLRQWGACKEAGAYVSESQNESPPLVKTLTPALEGGRHYTEGTLC